jgi:5,10-methylenetetrahydrofolate reductase
MVEDSALYAQIGDLVKEERELRSRLMAGEITRDEEHERLAQIEVALDQCWDLLRQRDARREFHENPDDAEVRPERVVESYEG